MRKATPVIATLALTIIATSLYAGMGLPMKCQPAKDSKDVDAVKACGYETMVTFGGGMFFEQVTGYCRSCKKFVHVNWTREGIPDEMKGRIKVKPRPEPLGEVWDANTGSTLTVYACPHCKGPFAEIKNAKELKHCPSCNNPNFVVDESKPRIAVD